MILTIYVIQAWLSPWKDIAVVLGCLSVIIVFSVIKNSSIARGLFFVFGIFFTINMLISGNSRPWLILYTAGLLFSYELVEYSLHHAVQAEDDQLHHVLMKAHARYLVVMTGCILGGSLGALWIFERVSIQLSENIYVNILLFCTLFFGILYALKYTTR
ncbi:MAG: hypothetical protein HXS47_00560 [Theionarchaea archaeon]|nr:hypothetical protein [Theionarchaea archaeon]